MHNTNKGNKGKSQIKSTTSRGRRRYTVGLNFPVSKAKKNCNSATRKSGPTVRANTVVVLDSYSLRPKQSLLTEHPHSRSRPEVKLRLGSATPRRLSPTEGTTTLGCITWRLDPLPLHCR
uniref:Uncharacterized protein n=1 Tax=Physcomitrium patens TaxID=3218 RepID=A0A2K1L268_PHYPA|nr:hypothetical protein PHYPA_002913 [Physcomitrium patens]